MGGYKLKRKTKNDSNDNKQRVAWIDMAKGIGILMVIAGHSLTSGSLLSKLIWSVHMPLFFMATGYTYKIRDLPTQMKKDFKGLLVPYTGGIIVLMLADMVYHLFSNIPVNLGAIIIEYVKRGLYGSGGHTLSLMDGKIQFHYIGAIWFLCAMFTGKILFHTIMKSGGRYKAIFIIALSYSGVVLTRLLDEKAGIWMPFSLQTGMTATVFLYTGYTANQEGWMSNKKISMAKVICFFIWSIVIVCGNGVYMVTNHYPLGLMDFIGAICGSACLAWISQWLDSISLLLKSGLCYLGRNSVIILVFHLAELNFVPWETIYRGIFCDSFTITGKTAVILILKVLWSILFVEIVHRIKQVTDKSIENYKLHAGKG